MYRVVRAWVTTFIIHENVSFIVLKKNIFIDAIFLFFQKNYKPQIVWNILNYPYQFRFCWALVINPIFQ